MDKAVDSPLFSAELFSPPLQYLLELLPLDRVAFPDEPASSQLSQNDQFSDLVLKHHLLWSVLTSVMGKELEVPEALTKPLLARYPTQATQALRVATKLKQIALLFEDAGLPFVPLKGVLLGQQLYGDPSRRHPGDIDILVEANRAQEAGKLLVSAEYHPVIPARWPTDEEWRILLRTHQHITLHTPDNSVEVELHWKAERSGRCFDLTLCKDELVQVEMMGHSYPQLPADLLLLYLAVHGNKHGWASLHWLVDFALLAKQLDYEGWQAVLDRARSCGYMNHLALACFLAADLFKISLPDQVRMALVRHKPNRFIRDMVVRRIEHGNPTSVPEQIKHLIYSMTFEQGLQARWAVLAKEWTDPNEWTRYNLPKSLFFLYYLIRPFSMFYRRILRPIFGLSDKRSIAAQPRRDMKDE
ncbi:nucleotidyltransferase family protein [bacterium]|nr:nucleotidyltransferase family protein [bacterium]